MKCLGERTLVAQTSGESNLWDSQAKSKKKKNASITSQIVLRPSSLSKNVNIFLSWKTAHFRLSQRWQTTNLRNLQLLFSKDAFWI